MAAPPPISQEQFRPVWRTPLAALLIGWMGFTPGLLLGAWRIAETAPPGFLLGLAVSNFAVAPVVLLVWSLWAMARDPVTGWLAPSAFLFFCGAMIPAWQPLTDAGMRLNFQDHRAAYDVIVAEAKAHHFAPGADGWVEGVQDGLRFRYRADRPGRIEFVWARSELYEAGVRYDDVLCTPTHTLKCLDRGRPLEGHYFHYASVE